MGSTFKRLICNEEGQGIAEYSLVLAFISLVCVAAFTSIGPAVRDCIAAFAADAYN